MGVGQTVVVQRAQRAALGEIENRPLAVHINDVPRSRPALRQKGGNACLREHPVCGRGKRIRADRGRPVVTGHPRGAAAGAVSAPQQVIDIGNAFAVGFQCGERCHILLEVSLCSCAVVFGRAAGQGEGVRQHKTCAGIFGIAVGDGDGCKRIRRGAEIGGCHGAEVALQLGLVRVVKQVVVCQLGQGSGIGRRSRGCGAGQRAGDPVSPIKAAAV